MRSLLLILKILVTASLLAHAGESLAIASKTTISKKNVRKNSLHNSSNVWERIRFGMQIPIFSSTPTTSVQSLPSGSTIAQKNILIKTTLLPASTLHHDDTNRTKLTAANRLENQTKIKSRLTSSLIQKQISDYANNSQPEEPQRVQSRIRTRLEFHPRSNKLDTSVSTEIVAKRAPIIAETVATVPAETEQNLAKSPVEKNTAEKEQRIIKQATVNERIGKQIAWYAQRPAYLQQVAERARPYLYHIVSGLSANHLPAELALLPIVESAYQPTAQSPKSAAGLWQFIPSTGLDFDLTQSDRYDGRLDIDASTQAAIRYLSVLKRHFNGDWLLALAAYNCGLGRVDDAISNNRANGLPTDYWSLHLPEETQVYVPRFLALSSIFANPKSYGLKLPSIKNEPYFVKVKVERQFDIDYLSKKNLSTIAELANLSYEQFVQLNPGYLKPTLDTDSPFTLLLPASNAKYLNQHLSHVERFITEPSILAPLQKRARAEEIQKNLPTAIASSLPDTLPRFTSPLLSLNLKTNQTTPRITSQPVIINLQAFTVGKAGSSENNAMTAT
jgi:soluble lytic murein transglycosylase-like protein